MGGEAAMRAAAKFAGSGVINPGVQGFPAVEHPFTSTDGKATRPVASICSSSDTNIDASAPVQKPCVGEPMPRLVFGGAPPLQEATSELKAALDVAYLSPDMLVTSNSEHLETNAVPNHAIQAFRLLRENPLVQTVVASIASDPNLVHAVMNNEAVVEYLHPHHYSSFISDMDDSMQESAVGAEILSNQSPNCFDDVCNSEEDMPRNEFCNSEEDMPRNGFCNSEEDMPRNGFCNSEEDMPRNGFKDFFQNIKVRVKEEMNSVSGYFQNRFGGSEAVDGSYKTKTTFVDRTSFMGLAVMVIMLVVLKRR